MSGNHKKYYSGHDRRENRGYFSRQHRGGNFKKTNNRGKNYRDNNNDVEMFYSAAVDDAASQFVRHRFSGTKSKRGGKNRNSQAPFQGHSRARENSWAKVVVSQGKKLDKSFLLKSLAEFSDTPFVPINFHYGETGTAVFFVEDWKTGSALSKFSHRLTTSDGFKVKIATYSSAPPNMRLDKEVLEKIKVCMSNRYDDLHKKLDLNKFDADKELKSLGVYAPLQRFQVLQNVGTIIEENIPQIQCLDLSGNKIGSLLSLSNLSKKCRGLQELDLSSNSLRYASALDSIKGLNLTSLNLNQNPLCDSFKDQATYLSAVRRRFPEITRLDGQTVAPVIGFEIKKDIRLPSTAGSFCSNEECKPLILNFIDQYYNIYDSSDRQPLLHAYSDRGLMSFTSSNKIKSSLMDYSAESRNLINVSAPDRRRRLLRQGRLSVVSFLCELPKTLHDRSAFIVDVTVMSPQMINFTVSGLFKEFEHEVDAPQRSPIRSFSRTFVVVPQGSGITIVNEMFHLGEPTSEQIKVAFKDPAPTPSPSPVPVMTTVAPNSVGIPGMPSVSADTQQQMVASFAEKSGMNSGFSAKCLAENEWNFEKAAQTFLELKKKGIIPPEAFIK